LSTFSHTPGDGLSLEQAVLDALDRAPCALTIEQLGAVLAWMPVPPTERELINVLSLMGLRGQIEVIRPMFIRLRAGRL